MGIIKAAASAIGGALGDQWLEVFEADDMGGTTVFSEGVPVRPGKGSNTKGTEKTISNGSVIHVYPNQFMLLVENGKVVDYTAEEGVYKVDNSSTPSMFNGQFGDSLKETFSRIKFGGVPSNAQRVFFVNTQEIKGQKFGTQNAINYFDTFYNAELFLRCHGNFSIKVTDPLLFYTEVIPKNTSHVDFEDISEQYLSEFLEALQASINQMSADGQRISFVSSKGPELSKYMSKCLDEVWKEKRGFEVEMVGIASISYDDESQKLINMRNQGAMMGDPSIREGYLQSEIARGIGAAGANTSGAGAAFMGMGIGMNATGGFMGAASATNAQQMQAQAASAASAGSWICACGFSNTGNFCTNCGKQKPVPQGAWTCTCGVQNSGNFCTNCGKPRA